MGNFSRTHALLALLRDGFHEESAGGTVELRDDGSPVLDYPITPYIWEGVRRALLAMAEIQFAAGARVVYPVHERAQGYTSWAQARAGIDALPMVPLLTRVVSAHVMGGCAMAATENAGVVNPLGRHWTLENLSIHDGSVFPTSLGANPQLSVYGITTKFTRALAVELGAPVPARSAP